MRPGSFSTLRVVLLVFAFLAAAFLGFRLGFLRRSLPDDALYTAALGLAVTGLCVLDARLLGKPIPLLARWVVLIAWPVSAPLCLIRSRGARGLLLLALLAFMLVGIYLVAWFTGVVSSGIILTAARRH
jgi:hypothetical protein